MQGRLALDDENSRREGGAKKTEVEVACFERRTLRYPAEIVGRPAHVHRYVHAAASDAISESEDGLASQRKRGSRKVAADLDTSTGSQCRSCSGTNMREQEESDERVMLGALHEGRPGRGRQKQARGRESGRTPSRASRAVPIQSAARSSIIFSSIRRPRRMWPGRACRI